MTYEQAHEAVLAGKRIRRPTWDRPWDHAIHVSRIREDQRSFFKPSSHGLVFIGGDASPLGDWGNLYTCPWSPREADLVATDWELFELPDEWASLDHAHPFT